MIQVKLHAIKDFTAILAGILIAFKDVVPGNLTSFLGSLSNMSRTITRGIRMLKEIVRTISFSGCDWEISHQLR